MGSEETNERIGVQCIELDRCESTNKTAAELLGLSKVQHGAVILAHQQTAGRGQRGREWVSALGLDLTFSVVLTPDGMRADGQFILAQVAALAVHDAVACRVKDPVRIKWPNDILVEDRKVAGILIECELQGAMVRSAIVGIGLNVNSADLDVGQRATSLYFEVGVPQDRMTVFRELLDRFTDRWGQARRDPTSLVRDYADRLWCRGGLTNFVLDGQPLKVRPLDVDEHGRLMVEHEDGRVYAYGMDRLRFGPR